MRMKFEEVLEKAKKDEITKGEALFLFESANDWITVSQLISTASYVRDKNLGRFFKLDAFILSSNKGCKTNPPCGYCGQASQKFKLFAKVATPKEVVESAKIAEQLGFNGVQCGGGCSGYKGAEAVEDTKIVKESTTLDVFVNYGADMSEENILTLKQLGVGRIGCSLETINEDLFKKIKPGDSLNERKKVAQLIDTHGVKLATGIMIGIGESYLDRVNHIFYLKNFENLSTIYISGFFPIPGTPMEGYIPATPIEIAKTMAITRLAHPYADLDGSFGRDDHLQLWIMAGTNRRIIHGIFESKNKSGFTKHFYGEPKQIGENFIFIDTLPIYLNMIKQMGLNPDLNQRGDKKREKTKKV
jgi:biotin synthase